MEKKITCIVGTRPEAIKMAPVIHALREMKFSTIVLSTGQHSQMLHQALSYFGIIADADLSIMEDRQTLDSVTSRVLSGVGRFLDEHPQDLVLVHGDTTTTMASALAAFYRHIPVGHIEAGLRSHNIGQPFPEEANRIITDRLSTLWFAPTPGAAANLKGEGLPVSDKTLFVTGNTVIDALYSTLEKTDHILCPQLKELEEFSGPVILMTAHRRESWGKPIESICSSIKEILTNHSDVRILIPVHKNPSVGEIIRHCLSREQRVILCEPLDYPDFVWAMNRSTLILTDSGGVQEEASGLKKPVLVMRDISERPEAVDSGTAILVGTSREKIVSWVSRILSDEEYRRNLVERCGSPFGDGTAAKKIAGNILRHYDNVP
ncbi:non-hydrolyzing UDP-N-acetylglucosamine 2-epimerase [Aminivibrio sp.]|uniref:non-hydrolyzing UDP-N-acetylglucosamine 2-epimerase n=1 Tax=Aminivibrio sp. TaxID=1872489 RepID=UPI0016B0078A|nr:UDP-N-acetylglucosamine 2-epimerase (non-hydrolyzing) [Synergistaceae bacterium]